MTAERELPPIVGRCVYCGEPTSGPSFCDGHSDLPEADELALSVGDPDDVLLAPLDPPRGKGKRRASRA